MKFFSINEADDEVPRIRQILHELHGCKTRLEAENVMLTPDEFEQLFEEPSSKVLQESLEEELDGEMLLVLKEFASHIKQLEDMGCIVRDFDKGIIDFPCKFQGKEVFLCWKLGEERIRHWHEWDSDFHGRKKILEIGVKHG